MPEKPTDRPTDEEFASWPTLCPNCGEDYTEHEDLAMTLLSMRGDWKEATVEVFCGYCERWFKLILATRGYQLMTRPRTLRNS